MDEFKKHLQLHKNKLDIHSVDEEVWQNIEKNILNTGHAQRHKKHSLIFHLSRYTSAAILLIFLGIGLIYFKEINPLFFSKRSAVKNPSTAKVCLKTTDTLRDQKTATIAVKHKKASLQKSTNHYGRIKNIKPKLNKIESKGLTVLDKEIYAAIHSPELRDKNTLRINLENQLTGITQTEVTIRKTLGKGSWDKSYLEIIYQQKLFLLRQIQDQIRKIRIYA